MPNTKPPLSRLVCLIRSANSFYTGPATPNTCLCSLTCVCPQMSLQVAALAVHLAAAWLSTSVALRPLPRPSTCTRAPQLPLRQPWRGSRRTVRSWHHLLSHPRQVGQDASNHEHGGTGRGGDWLVTRVYWLALHTEVEGCHPNTGLQLLWVSSLAGVRHGDEAPCSKVHLLVHPRCSGRGGWWWPTDGAAHGGAGRQRTGGGEGVGRGTPPPRPPPTHPLRSRGHRPSNQPWARGRRKLAPRWASLPPGG